MSPEHWGGRRGLEVSPDEQGGMQAEPKKAVSTQQNPCCWFVHGITIKDHSFFPQMFLLLASTGNVSFYCRENKSSTQGQENSSLNVIDSGFYL